MNKIEELLKDWNNGILRGSKKALADILGVPDTSISHWIAGRANPSEIHIRKMSSVFKKSEIELQEIFGIGKKIPSEVDLKSVFALNDSNTINLPILAGVPAGLPEYSDKDVAYFTSIPRALFPGADFVVECIGDSLEPRILKGDFCVIRKMDEALHGKPMLVKTEDGFCMKVICKEGKKIKLCSVNHGYKPFIPKELEIVGLILGTWSRHDKDNWLHTEGK